MTIHNYLFYFREKNSILYIRMSAPRRRQVVRKSQAPVPQRKARGRGAYNIDSTYKRTKANRKAAKKAGNYEPSFGRSLLTEGGSLLGGLVGLPGIGKAAGNALSNVFGLGDYEIKENVFMEGRLPQMVNMPAGGGTVIRFQEYISDIYTTADIANPSAFNIQSYLINAANSITFPWLSQLAANYEQYFVEGMIFEFRSTSADALNSTNTALGSVMLATQYDVADPVFRSKAEMLNYEYSNSIKPSDNCMHMIECAPSQTVLAGLYTLDGSVPSGTDSRLYHLGRFNIATVGFQAANVNIGELHVTYQVRLLKPKLYSELGFANDFAVLTNVDYSNVQPWNVTDSTWGYNTLNNFNVRMVAGTLNIPATSVIKSYRIEASWASSTPAAIVFPLITVANGTLVGPNDTLAPGGGETASRVVMSFVVTTTGNSKITAISMGGAGLLPPDTGGLALIRIMQVPQGSTV